MEQPTLVFLFGESQWTEEPGGLQSMGSQRVGPIPVCGHGAQFGIYEFGCMLYISSGKLFSLPLGVCFPECFKVCRVQSVVRTCSRRVVGRGAGLRLGIGTGFPTERNDA